jgi:hypothetical protein
MSMVERMHNGAVVLRPVTPSGRYDARAVLRWASQFSVLASVLVQPSSQHPLLWWGVNSTVFGKHHLDSRPELHGG